MAQFLALLILSGFFYFLYKLINPYLSTTKLEQANQRLGELQTQLTLSKSANIEKEFLLQDLQQNFEKLRFAKISGDVKLGQKAEQLAGLAENFPAPLHTLKFLGAPIDYVSIDLEKELITFIEVKTGQSKLSETQKKIRKIIKDKNVEFREFRI